MFLPTAATGNSLSLATFGAAVTVVLVGSAGYLLRRRFGLVKPPPEQGPEH